MNKQFCRGFASQMAVWNGSVFKYNVITELAAKRLRRTAGDAGKEQRPLAPGAEGGTASARGARRARGRRGTRGSPSTRASAATPSRRSGSPYLGEVNAGAHDGQPVLVHARGPGRAQPRSQLGRAPQPRPGNEPKRRGAGLHRAASWET